MKSINNDGAAGRHLELSPVVSVEFEPTSQLVLLLKKKLQAPGDPLANGPRDHPTFTRLLVTVYYTIGTLTRNALFQL